MSHDFADLLVDGHRILPSLLRDLRAAQRSIHCSVFLFFRDPIGEEVAGVLVERARAGVSVRVLLNLGKTAMGDPFSTGERQMLKHDTSIDYNPLDAKPLCEALTNAGVQVLDSDIDYDREVSAHDPRLRSLAAQIRNSIDVDVLHIDHRKLVIVDGRIAYCGGANIGAQYLFHEPFDPKLDARVEGEARRRAGQPEPWWKWHDSLTRFEGPLAGAIENEFRVRWILDGGDEYHADRFATETQEPGRGVPIREARVVVTTPDDQPNAVRELYLTLIREVTRSIFIENPYLYHPAITKALCEAKRARPELEVVLVVPAGKHNDNSFAQDAQEYHYKSYIECGIEVYEYQNHFNHLKMAVFDERFSLHGSTNLNYRSLEDDKDFELVVFVDDASFAAEVLREVRDVDIQCSKRITRADVAGISLHALRKRVRDPRTLLLLSRRML